MAREPIAVLGGGITGITVAYGLARRGYPVVLFERARLGGLLRSVEAGGLVFDVGSFVFPDGGSLFDVFPVLRERFVRVPVPWLTLTGRGRFDRYPITLRGFARDNGSLGLGAALLDLIRCRLRHPSMDSARAFATRHVGGVFYRRSGLQHYLERLFGLPDEEVGAEFAEQRMGFLSRLSLARSVGREIARLWAAARIHPMMEDLGTDRVLVRPREGFSAVFAILEEQLAAAGVEVCLDTQIRGVHRRGGRFSIRTSRGDELFGSVASTIPVDTLLQAMGEDQDEPLERMSLLSLFYRGRLLPDAGSLYNFTPRGGWKRLAIFSKFYGREEGEDYFTVEITTRETDEPTKAALRADFEQHVRDLELFAGDVRWVGDCVSQDAYPVLRRGCKALAEDRRRRLQSQGIRLAGRQGRFEYSNVETCVRQAQALVESMAQAARP